MTASQIHRRCSLDTQNTRARAFNAPTLSIQGFALPLPGIIDCSWQVNGEIAVIQTCRS